MFKNVASQKIAVYAHDISADAAKTGDDLNITAQISKDGAATAPTNDVNPTELDPADAPGVYLFDMTQAETNADLVIVAPISSTSNIQLEPVFVYTVTASTHNAAAVVTALMAELIDTSVSVRKAFEILISDVAGNWTITGTDPLTISLYLPSDTSKTTLICQITWDENGHATVSIP